MKIIVTFEVAKDGGIWGYSSNGVFGRGQTVEECREDFLRSYEEFKEELELHDAVFEWRYDIASFFKYYKVLDVTAFAKRINMNASLMRRYKAGTPVTEKTYLRIREGIHSVGQELMTAFM